MTGVETTGTPETIKVDAEGTVTMRALDSTLGTTAVIMRVDITVWTAVIVMRAIAAEVATAEADGVLAKNARQNGSQSRRTLRGGERRLRLKERAV